MFFYGQVLNNTHYIMNIFSQQIKENLKNKSVVVFSNKKTNKIKIH